MKSELRFRVSDVVRRSPAAIAPYRASALQYVLPNKATAFSQFSRLAGVQDHGRPVSARSGNHARYSPVMRAPAGVSRFHVNERFLEGGLPGQRRRAVVVGQTLTRFLKDGEL